MLGTRLLGGDIGEGMQTGRNNVFGNLFLKDVRNLKLEKKCLRKRARNSDIERYIIKNRGEFLIYVEELQFNECPQNTKSYLKSHQSELKERAAYKRGDCKWWTYTWALHKDLYNRPKIICPYLARKNRFALDKNKEYISLTDTTVLFKKENTKENMNFLLALLNSNVLTFRFRSIGKLRSEGVYEYFWNSVSKLPIRTIDFSNPKEKKMHDDLVAMVDKMLELHKKYHSTRLEYDKKLYKTQLDHLDHQIDTLVYKLYGLTKGEIKVVEGE